MLEATIAQGRAPNRPTVNAMPSVMMLTSNKLAGFGQVDEEDEDGGDAFFLRKPLGIKRGESKKYNAEMYDF
jgi:hypothetical protein